MQFRGAARDIDKLGPSLIGGREDGRHHGPRHGFLPARAAFEMAVMTALVTFEANVDLEDADPGSHEVRSTILVNARVEKIHGLLLLIFYIL
jgi:hypothetical protein